MDRYIDRLFDIEEDNTREGTTQKKRRSHHKLESFNDTILHNIKYGRVEATMEEVYAAADAAQIRSFIESLPEKVD